MDSVAPRRSHPPDARFCNWLARDGWPVRRMDWVQTGRTRGSLLFVGGRGDFIEKYLELYRQWHDDGWNVTAFDWRGQGASRGDIIGGNVLSFDAWVDDLDGLIADWRQGCTGPYAVVAHSMGGHLLLRTLVERSPRVDAAVLIAPMLAVNSGPVPAWLAPWIARLIALVAPRRSMRGTPVPSRIRQRNLTGCSPERYEDELWWWEQDVGFNLGTPSWGWLDAAYRSAARAFTPAKLAQVKIPILILASAVDRLVSAAAIERAVRLLPKAELKLYPDAAHELLREGDAVRLDAIARIDAFLAEHAK